MFSWLRNFGGKTTSRRRERAALCGFARFRVVQKARTVRKSAEAAAAPGFRGLSNAGGVASELMRAATPHATFIEINQAPRPQREVTVPAKEDRYHVTKTKTGWQGKAEGAKRAAVTGKTKAEVVERTREIAKNNDGQMIVHKRDHTFQYEHTYGHDPESRPS